MNHLQFRIPTVKRLRNRFLNLLNILVFCRMPYYRIVVTLKDGRVHRGIRVLEVWNPDTALRMVEQTARLHFGEHKVGKVEVAMLPRSSDEVKRHLSNLGKGGKKKG